MTAARGNRRRGGERCAQGAGRQPHQKQERVLRQHHREQMPRAVPHRAQQGQLPSPLQHVAHQHRRQSHGAQDQPQTAERAERRKVRVLYLVETGQERPAGLDLESVIGKRSRQRARDLVRLAGRSVYEEEAVTLGIRKQPQKVLFRDDQLALEQAVLERRHNPVADPGQFELFAQLPVQRVGQRIGVGDGRNGAVRKRRFQQQPGIPRPALDGLEGEAGVA